MVEKGDLRVKSMILSMLETKGIDRLLDIGSGNGAFSIEVAKKLAADQLNVLDALDYSEHWQRLGKGTGTEVNGQIFDLDNLLPFENECFDVVLSNQVVEHLYDPFTHLREIRRVLKDDGYAIIGTPNLSSLQYRVMLALGLMPSTLSVGLYQFREDRKGTGMSVTKYVRHISCFTVREFSEVLIEIGFEISRTKTCVVYFLPRFLERFVTFLCPWGNYMIFKVRKA